jgi:hypothetical protein
MQRQSESRAAGARFQLLWQTVETANTGPADSQIRGQLLSLLAAAHQSRETRLVQMTQSVPGLVWSLLIIFASALIGCMLVFAAEASISKAVLVGVFTSSLTLALLTVHVLDSACLVLSQRDAGDIVKAKASTRTAGTFLRATPGMLPPGSASLPRAIARLPYVRRRRGFADPPRTSSSATGLETMVRRLDPPANPHGDRGFESVSLQRRVSKLSVPVYNGLERTARQLLCRGTRSSNPASSPERGSRADSPGRWR